MLYGYIVDPETGKNVAVIRHGEVFRRDKEGVRIATVINANLYDLSGNLLGRLDGQQVFDVRTRADHPKWIYALPAAARNNPIFPGGPVIARTNYPDRRQRQRFL